MFSAVRSGLIVRWIINRVQAVVDSNEVDFQEPVPGQQCYDFAFLIFDGVPVGIDGPEFCFVLADSDLPCFDTLDKGVTPVRL